ncbi:MAG: tRNA lysidine(34) synthetase TilS [Pirellulaceae bacterium]
MPLPSPARAPSDSETVSEDELQSLDHDLLRGLARGWFGTEFSKTRCLLAVSGGADSVSLLIALLELSSDETCLEVAHFNHGWRGAESDEDEQFVRDLCARLGVAFHSMKSPGSLARSEAAARDERYQFLETTAYRIGARSVATAHTLNDRVESTLHNLFRGTGVAGIRSIEPHRPLGEDLILVRPMLRCNRSQVIDYLELRQQAYRDDSSNEDTKYRRNFLRHQILPAVRETYGEDVDGRVGNFADLLAEHLDVIELRVRHFAEATELLLSKESRLGRGNLAESADPQELLVSRCVVSDEPWPVVREYLVRCWRDRGWPLSKYSALHWNIIRAAYEIDLKDDESAPQNSQHGIEWQFVSNLPGDLTLESNARWLRIRRTASSLGVRT